MRAWPLHGSTINQIHVYEYVLICVMIKCSYFGQSLHFMLKSTFSTMKTFEGTCPRSNAK